MAKLPVAEPTVWWYNLPWCKDQGKGKVYAIRQRLY